MSNPYENKPLDGIDDDLAQWFALGKSIKWMVKQTGLAEITIRHRKMNPLLKKAIEEERRRITEANRGAVIAASIDAIRELHKIIKEKEGDKKDKISASKVVLDQRNKDGEVESMLKQLEELRNELLASTNRDQSLEGTDQNESNHENDQHTPENQIRPNSSDGSGGDAA